METSIIEKTEKTRFNALLLEIIFATITGVAVIVGELSLSKQVIEICSIIIIIFCMLFVCAAFKFSLISRKISQNKEMAAALNNEMYISFNKKAFAFGFYCTVISVVMIMFLDEYLNLAVKTYCFIILYIAVISSGVRRLFLYK